MEVIRAEPARYCHSPASVALRPTLHQSRKQFLKPVYFALDEGKFLSLDIPLVIFLNLNDAVLLVLVDQSLLFCLMVRFALLFASSLHIKSLELNLVIVHVVQEIIYLRRGLLLNIAHFSAFLKLLLNHFVENLPRQIPSERLLDANS